jgi:hypothetical protein
MNIKKMIKNFLRKKKAYYIVMNRLIVISIVAFVIFLISFDYSTFSSYTLLGMGILGLIFYFGFEHILTMLQDGKSVLSIIIFVIILSILSSLGYAGYMIYTNKQEINKKWPEYRCKPYIMPFAGWAVGPSGTSGTENFTNCIWNINKSFFDILMAPFIDAFKMIVNILSSITKDIQNIRKIITYMRDSMEDLAKDVNQKIWDAYYRISYLLKIILKTFAKLGDVFKDLFEVLTYVFYTMASLWNGPIGKIAKFFCFDGLTPIRLQNGQIKPIKDIRVGDILKGNNGVKGILEFNSENVEMYDYHSIVVSGDHLVREDGKWVRVKDSQDADRIDYYFNDRIYCLITETSEIEINGIRFGDYNETSDYKVIRNIYNKILVELNKNVKPIEKNIEMEMGLDENIIIIMRDGSEKKLKDVKIGDEIKYCGKVLGKAKILPKNVCKYNDMIMTDNNIILYDNEWMPLMTVKEIEYIHYDKCMYHIFTDSNIINTKDTLISDFEQINTLNEDIDEYIENIKNQS